MTAYTNRGLFERAQRVMPGGVSSPVRAFGSVGGTPYFVADAQGAFVTDVEGNRYLDYVQSYGAIILGHAHPQVLKAVQAAVSKGTTYGAPTPGEVLMCEELTRRVPGLEMARLVSSGTEAGMSAIRLARGATGRDVVLKFAGCYHGHSDSLLAAGGSGIANQGISGSAGVTSGSVADTIVAPYNVVPALDERVAAVIVEPVAANMGLVAPVPGFLEGLREACTANGSLLIFDEVITGCRIARGGATEHFGVVPDLWCFGKVIGGGMPIGAFGGRRELMSRLAPVGDVYQAGTLSGNPVATAAGLAVLELLDDTAYTMLAGRAGELQRALHDAIAGAALPVQVPRVGTLVGLHFTDSPVRDYDDAKRAAGTGLYREFFNALLRRGIAMAPGPYEALFPSLAHTWDDIERTADLAAEAAREVAKSAG